MTRLSPITLENYRPLREIVFETLREAIISGVLKPGERLMEVQLAEEMGLVVPLSGKLLGNWN